MFPFSHPDYHRRHRTTEPRPPLARSFTDSTPAWRLGVAGSPRGYEAVPGSPPVREFHSPPKDTLINLPYGQRPGKEHLMSPAENGFKTYSFRPNIFGQRL